MESKPYRHNPRVLHAITVCGLLLTGALVARQGWFEEERPQTAEPIAVVFPVAEPLPEEAPAAVSSAPRLAGRELDLSEAAWLQELLKTGYHRQARAILMEQAAAAAAAGDQRVLGDRLLWLGRVAIAEQDLDSAEVFLLEAMELAVAREDAPAVAHINLELGRTHLRSRELARQAGEAYDLLLVARNELQRGRYAESGEKLATVIEENMAIRRYGAAASAYESLADLYLALHDRYLSELALAEAARLYARSGASQRARLVLRQLQRSGIDSGQMFRLQQELEASLRRFRNDMMQVERARDYQRLYRHYAASGNQERAWQLRLMASQSLARTSRRSLFHRQPDVLAVLYDSNRAMDRARSYLDLASDQFNRQGLTEMALQSRALTAMVH